MFFSKDQLLEMYKNAADVIRYPADNGISKDNYPYVEADQNTLNGFVDALLNKGYLSDKKSQSICDVGFGLGTSLYNINLQIKFNSVIKNKFYFTAIEYNEKLVELFNQFLKYKWENINVDISEKDIEVIADDLFNLDFSKYDVVYMYSPLKEPSLVYEGYKHIYSSMKQGAVLYERYNRGCGVHNILDKFIDDNNLKTDLLYFGDGINKILIK